ncbi:efflux RND transporter periplasmic adaptor subunit [Rosenbergiella australiborealis]|uniref:Efflux RND transporter periplasmic adaptor subunit n=1 Tax=Rosenbergiella australiborealis TaxID=1544696 RepID=A0ABS5T7K3_9GAMM|nr:efflux RND transporter periplasmic adaptor subunit [Rosenbergiella australiborealis]MBT0728336.1 efflux RND transporter periplasmic adaptor subunit [Rosenbergiella australiborealis]
MTNTSQRPVRRTWLKKLAILLSLVVLAVIIWRLYATHSSSSSGGPPMGRHGMRPGMGGANIVHAVRAQQADVPVYVSAPGTVIPNASVTVTSRITGQLDKVFFTEGQKVTAGQLLAQIDDRDYQATLAQYQGALAENQALLNNAELTLARYRKLYAQDSLSKQDLESQIATVGQYRGSVQQDLAQINNAKVSISYARITAPVSGRVGLRLVDAGNLVQSGDSTGIVTITQMQPAAVTFSVPQRYVGELSTKLHQGQALPATAFDQDGTTVLAEGEVRFISNTIDTTTGSIALKAMFANEKESLFANQFVNLRLQIDRLKQATVVSTQAIQLSSDGSFVFIIQPDNTVIRQAVKTGPLFGEDQQVVFSGVKPGDRVVSDGIDRLVTGSKVTVADETPSTTSSESAQSKAE